MARSFARLLPAVALATALVVLPGCAPLINKVSYDPATRGIGDRCFIEDEQFLYADKIYQDTYSLEQVERQLRKDEQWRRCEINEAIYRLKKVHNLP
jgi:hypothetical protein